MKYLEEKASSSSLSSFFIFIKFNVSSIIFLLFGCWSVGVATRFICMSSTDVYMINDFDRLFDFGILLVFGLFGIFYFYFKYFKFLCVKRSV